MCMRIWWPESASLPGVFSSLLLSTVGPLIRSGQHMERTAMEPAYDVRPAGGRGWGKQLEWAQKEGDAAGRALAGPRQAGSEIRESSRLRLGTRK
ncbi:hypothetical protein AcV5_009408 [Taiwanofungus camphoratus]|nr:hypothetical protein AcV5_009408 [Antrodia cinnamomea]